MFMTRIGFWGPLYYNHNEEPPKKKYSSASAWIVRAAPVRQRIPKVWQTNYVQRSVKQNGDACPKRRLLSCVAPRRICPRCGIPPTRG